MTDYEKSWQMLMVGDVEGIMFYLARLDRNVFYGSDNQDLRKLMIEETRRRAK